MMSVRGRPASSGRAAGFVPILIVAVLLGAVPTVRVFLAGRPREVLVVYVREENSLGLAALPPPGAGAASRLDPVAGRLVLPAGAPASGGVPAGTRALVLRETYCAGVLAEARVVFVRRWPVLVSGRPSGAEPASPAQGEGAGLDFGSARLPTGLDPGSTLLPLDLIFDLARPAGGASPAVRVEAPGLVPEAGAGAGSRLPAVLGPGQEWRLAAVLDAGGVRLLSPLDPGYEDSLRQAFYDDRPISVLSVTNLGVWEAERITPEEAGPPPG